MRPLALALALLALPAVSSAQESALDGLRSSTDPASRLRLGRALRRAGRFDEAVRTLNAIRDRAVRPDAMWEVAQTRFDQGSFRPAEAACRNVTPAFRQRVCRARAYLVWNRVALANRELNAAQSQGSSDGEYQLALADARRLMSDVSAATTAYNAASQLLPGRAEPFMGLAALHEIGQRPDDAEAQYRRAVAADPTDPAAALALGRFLLRRRENPTEALPFLQRASADRPHWAEALGAFGEALVGTGAHAQALPVLEEAARLSPTQPGVQTALGRALAGAERWTEAEAHFRRAIEQVGTDAQAYMGLADVMEHTDRDTEAMEQWDHAIDRAPGSRYARMRAARLAHRTRQNALARAYLDRVLSDDPQSAEALMLRGMVAADENDRPSARRFLNAALGGNGPIDRNAVQEALRALEQPVRQRRR